MPPPTGYTLESAAPHGYIPESFDTPLSSQDETKFQAWKQKYAPKDSGADYDLRGAFKAGLTPDPQTGHWPDTFKKPNHPTFSNESQYAKFAPEKAGSWAGPNRDVYVKPGESYDEGSQPASLGGTARAFARQTPQGLAMIGSILGSVIGAPIGGAAVGASTGQALKNIAPSIFGAPGVTTGERVVDYGGDILSQGVLPSILGSIASRGLRGAMLAMPGTKTLAAPAVKIAQLVNQAKGYMMPESSLVETAAENMRQNLPNIPGKQNIPETSLNELFNVPYNQTGISTTKIAPIVKDMLSDVTTVRNMKLATGNPTLIRQMAANDLVTRNYYKAADTINPTAILNELGNKPDIYEEAFGKPALDTFTALMKTAQDKGVGKATDLMSWREGRKVLLLSLPFRALGVPFGAAEGIIFGSDAIKKVISNPQLGQMILQATKTNASAPEASLLSQAIVHSLRGASLYLKKEDGSKEKIQVSQDGQLQTPH